MALGESSTVAGELPATAHFRKAIQPILTEYCYDCHADGANKGNVAFDELKTDASITGNHELWTKVLKNVRAGLMPPLKKPRPSPEEQQRLVDWIKYDAFGIDPKNPDPGRVTVRRLNRVEYKNTIRDLLGVDYDTDTEFPPDDTGYGFDNIGDVLNLPPMLFEKYVAAARTIIGQVVPTVARVMPEQKIVGRTFQGTGGKAGDYGKNGIYLSYYQHALVTNVFQVTNAGRYDVWLDLTATEKFVDDQFDYNKCRVIFKIDGQEQLRKEYVREGNQPFHYEFKRDWKPGAHEFSFEVESLTTNEQLRALAIRLDAVTLRGPADEKFWVRPTNHARFFPKETPQSAAEKRAYAGEILRAFATKAFRRPVSDEMVNRLAALAEGVYGKGHASFEAGVAEAMTAVLASPRFLFREEEAEVASRGQANPNIDEYSLASRLSYFLWSSMPDDELLRLAAKGELRKNLPAQVKRMLEDWRAQALVANFTGQWLQARDIESVPIEARAVLAQEEKADPEREKMRKRVRELADKRDDDKTPAEKEEETNLRKTLFRGFRQPRPELTGELRYAMRREVEMYFDNIIRKDRSLMELIESDYTYLNEKLARHYGLTNLDVSGSELRRVTLPADSPRGGVLTMGDVLVVTSNPTRTSPVKRGLFILDNIMGTPPPPPPPNIPPLEDASKDVKDHTPTLRETLALHRSAPLCSSCHNRMDPLGLAFENFNAMGMWRECEHGQPIECTGQLITGEPFQNVRELKHIFATKHRLDFYRTLTEKMLTYALGRGLEYSDVETVDQIVSRLEKEDGRASALLMGVMESAPFQKRRGTGAVSDNRTSSSEKQQQRADAGQHHEN